jgi:transcriptional regulator with XRE-family HTH domain
VETIGDLVRKRREALGLTLSQVATASGIHPSFISRVENDLSEPGLDGTIRLAEALSLDTDLMLNVFGLATNDQRRDATDELKGLIGTGLSVDLPVIGTDGEPTGDVKRVELPRPDDAFVVVGNEPPWDGHLVASRTRVPVEGVGVVVRTDHNLRAGTFHRAGRRRSWVEFPDGQRLDYPDEVFVIIRHG